MKNNNYKPQIPDVMEAIFDAAYLIFDLIAAILFFLFSKGNVLFILYGIDLSTLRRRCVSSGAQNKKSSMGKQ